MLHLEINVKRRHIYALVAAVALIVAILPVASWASHTFNDVPDTNIFHDDISWLADAGVTKGCNPPANDEFCPGDNVRRETMAAFMRRLAENQVVDAKTAIEAENADTLDGMDATDFAPAAMQTGLASDSKDGTEFPASEAAISSVDITYPGPGFVFVTVEGYAECPTGTLWQRLIASNLTGASFYLGSDMDGSFNNWSNQYVWEVAGAGTTTFSSSGYNTGGACTGGGTGNLTAMFVPTAYGAISGSASVSSNQPTP